MCCFCRGEASSRQYRTAAEEKVLLHQRLRQQIVINDGLQSKLADQNDELAEAQGENKRLQKRMVEMECEVLTATSR